MAKYKGGSSGGELGDFDIESLLTKEDVKPVGGIIGQAFYKLITRNIKTKEEAINLELRRVKREGTEQEKQSAHNALVRHAKEQALKKLSEKDKKELEILNQQIRYAEKKLADFELKQKRADDIYKQQEAKLRIEIANAKKAGQNTDALEQQLKDAQAQFQKESASRNKNIQDAKKSIAEKKDKTGQIYAPLEKKLKQQYSSYGLDMSRINDKDYVLNEHGSSAELAHANAVTGLEYENAKLQSFAIKVSGLGGRGRLDTDLGDEPTIRTKPQQKQVQQERHPSPQEMASLYNTDLGDLSAGIVSAVPDKMQQNLNQNLRDEELKHRTERESLTDQYREQVLENLKEQTYQLTTIQENLHAIYDNMGQGGSGGGLLGGLGDMLSSLAGGALASKVMGLVKGGLGLAKGALTKIPVLGSVLGAGIGAGAGALDTEAIMAQKGLTDPSQIGLGARIQRGGAGLISGALNALSFGLADKVFGINTENLTEGFDRWGNILSGNGNRTDAEVRAMQDSQTSIDADEAEMNALLASRGIIQTADGSYQIKDNSIHGQILEKMGIETAKVQQEQELAELNEGMGGVMNSSVSNVTNNSTTNIIPESPRFRVNDTATMALSAQGL